MHWDNREFYQEERATPKKLPTPTMQTSYPRCSSMAANIYYSIFLDMLDFLSSHSDQEWNCISEDTFCFDIDIHKSSPISHTNIHFTGSFL